MIELSALHAGYRNYSVLQGISLHITQGEFTGILGPNGNGKTTLIRTLSGVLPPISGTVHVQGQNLYALSPKKRARLCATVPQNQNGYSGITVRNLVMTGRYAHSTFLGGYTAEDQAKVEHALAITNIQDLSDRMSETLSGGELQRVMLARALVQEAPIMLLDEAASNLDAARTIELYSQLRTCNAQGMTILTVAHDLNLAALYCQRLIFLKHGRIVCDGPTRDVFTATNLSRIYETEIIVASHPTLDVPQAHLLPRL